MRAGRRGAASGGCGEVELRDAEGSSCEGLVGGYGDGFDLVVGEAGGGVGMGHRAAVEIEEAGVAGANEDGGGVRGAEGGDFEVRGVGAFGGEAEAGQGCAVEEEDAGVAGAEEEVTGGKGEEGREVAEVGGGGEELVESWGGVVVSSVRVEEEEAGSGGGEEELGV